MTCKRVASLAAQTNGEVERGTRYAHRKVAEEEDGTRRRPCSTGGGPTFSDIVKDPLRHEDSAGEADFASPQCCPDLPNRNERRGGFHADHAESSPLPGQRLISRRGRPRRRSEIASRGAAAGNDFGAPAKGP